METLPDNLLFELAKHLPLVSLYRLSLCSTQFRWLIDDNLLFKHLCQRDFATHTHIFPATLQKQVVPNYPDRQKFVYKVLEYLRREITLSLAFRERRFNVTVQTVYIPKPGQRVTDCINLETPIGSDGLAYFHEYDLYDPEMAQLRCVNLDHKCSALDCEFMEEPCDGEPFGNYVIIVKEGLAVYVKEKSKYYLVIPTSGVVTMFKMCGYNMIDDEDLEYDGKMRKDAYKNLHPDVSDEMTIYRNISDEANFHTDHFGFRRI